MHNAKNLSGLRLYEILLQLKSGRAYMQLVRELHGPEFPIITQLYSTAHQTNMENLED